MQPGQRIGKYVLGERIAVGGMAEVWAARAEGPEGFVKPVALKFILESFSGDPELEKLFVKEARTAAQLQHANLVTVFDFDKVVTDPDRGAGGRYYIAMEHVEGYDARRVVEAARHAGYVFPQALGLYLGGEVLKGLRYVHERREKGQALGLVHRDVSPHNVLVGFSGEVKLSDFGIAKSLAHSTHTKTGTVRGKLSYASPEQLNGEPVDHRTDQFAMGITLWEILAGRPLFDGNDEVEIVGKVMRCDIPPLALVSPERKVLPPVESFVRRMLSPRREQRYATTKEALSALLALPGYSADGAPLGELVRTLFHRPSVGTASPGTLLPAVSTPAAAAARAAAAPLRRGSRREAARGRAGLEVPASVHDGGGAPLPSEIETRTMARASVEPAPGRRSRQPAATTAPVRRGARRAWTIGLAVAIAAAATAVGIIVSGRDADEPPVAAAPEAERPAAAPTLAAGPPANVAVAPAREPAVAAPADPPSPPGIEAVTTAGEGAAPARGAPARPAVAPLPTVASAPALVTLPVIVRSPPAVLPASGSGARSLSPSVAGSPAHAELQAPAMEQAPVRSPSPSVSSATTTGTTTVTRGDGGAANGAPIVE